MRSTFVVAALVLSWVALGVLAFVCANLLLRLQRLEARPSDSRAENAGPYGHLAGIQLRDLLPSGLESAAVVLLVSSACRRCHDLVGELDGHAAGVIVAPMDEAMAKAAGAGGLSADSGREIAARLGVRLTPFAIAVDVSGAVIAARPVSSSTNIDDLTVEADRLSTGTRRGSHV